MFSTRTYFNVNEYLVYVYVHVQENLLGGLIQLTPFPVHYHVMLTNLLSDVHHTAFVTWRPKEYLVDPRQVTVHSPTHPLHGRSPDSTQSPPPLMSKTILFIDTCVLSTRAFIWVFRSRIAISGSVTVSATRKIGDSRAIVSVKSHTEVIWFYESTLIWYVYKVSISKTRSIFMCSKLAHAHSDEQDTFLKGWDWRDGVGVQMEGGDAVRGGMVWSLPLISLWWVVERSVEIGVKKKTRSEITTEIWDIIKHPGYQHISEISMRYQRYLWDINMCLRYQHILVYEILTFFLVSTHIRDINLYWYLRYQHISEISTYIWVVKTYLS